MLAELDRPGAIIAQSMGGIVAMLAALHVPTLLLRGDADPISPVQVGRRLVSLLPQAELHVFAGADHDLGCTLAQLVAPLVDRYLAS